MFKAARNQKNQSRCGLNKLLLVFFVVFILHAPPACCDVTYDDLQSRVFELEDELRRAKEDEWYKVVFRMFFAIGMIGLNIHSAVRASDLEDEIRKARGIIEDLRERKSG